MSFVADRVLGPDASLISQSLTGRLVDQTFSHDLGMSFVFRRARAAHIPLGILYIQPKRRGIVATCLWSACID